MWFIEGDAVHRGRSSNIRAWLKPGTTLTLGRQDKDPNVLCVGTDVNTVRGAPSKLTIRDLSQNGVFLDGTKIQRQQNVDVIPFCVTSRHSGAWSTFLSNAMSQVESKDQDSRSSVAGSGYISSVNMTIGNMKFRIIRVDLSIAFAGMSSSDKVEASQLAADMDFRTLAESSGIQWFPNFKRKFLFDHLLFVFLAHDAKASKWEACIQSAGGVVTKEEPSNAKAVIRRCLMQDKKEPVFLRPVNEDAFAQISPTVDPILKKMGYRWVETKEIGMAILAVSTEQFCNPKYKGALPTLDDRITNATMSSFSTLDPRHSSLMQPLPEESTIPSSLIGGRKGDLHRDETEILQDVESSQALLPSLNFDDLLMPRRGNSSRAITSKLSKPTPTRPQALSTTTTTNTTAVTAAAASSLTKPDAPKKIRRLDMFLDDDDDVIIMDQAPKVLKTPTPVEAPLQRSPIVSGSLKSVAPSPSASTAPGTPSRGSTVTTAQGGNKSSNRASSDNAASTATTAAARVSSDAPIMLESDDEFDFGLPPRRSRAKKDDSVNIKDSDRDMTNDEEISVPAPAPTSSACPPSTTDHIRTVDDEGSVKKSDRTKSVETLDSGSGKRRKILTSDSTSQVDRPSDMFDDLDEEGEKEETKKDADSSISVISSSASTSMKKGGGSSTTATVGRKKLNVVHQDISLYHIEDMIHHQSELEKFKRQEVELQQRQEIERLEKEYKRATSLGQETTTTSSRSSGEGITEAGEQTKKQSKALMTSVFNERLLDKGKRRKLLMESEIKKENEQDSIVTSLSKDLTSSSPLHQHISRVGERVASLSLQGQDHPDWPEHWKKMSNFKTRPPVDPVLIEKWKGRPNFKAFRKTVMPGIPMTNRPPVPLMSSQQ
ncbi:hypothetical protein BGW41_004459 [Actinomortierella wolfii]|nr:hypothetical protein BGW41_004459 [Actinomortierella wolfii]